MISSIPFNQIPGFSRLFCEFVKGNSLLLNRFPQSNEIDCASRAANFSNRTGLLSAIKSTMSGLDLHDSQRNSINALRSDAGLAVATGQQVGFLGGYGYTALKLFSAVQKSKNLGDEYPDFQFAPIFWVEDDDHDYVEAAETTALNERGEPFKISCAAPDEPLKYTVGSRHFSERIIDILNELSASLPQTEHSEKLINLLSTCYYPGASWSVAFIRLLHELFGSTGILFVSASEVRKHELGASVIIREIENRGEVANCVNRASEYLISAGFHAQIACSEINLFYIGGDGKRMKIRTEGDVISAGSKRWNIRELLKEAEEYPSRFSPNAALRPIVQDVALPTVHYAAGPGEVAYFAQLREAYNLFGATMPIIVQRHSATFLTPAAKRFLEKSDYSPEYFLRAWNEIDRDVANATRTIDFDVAFMQANSLLHDAFNKLEVAASQADATLRGSVLATLNQTLKSVEHIKTKALASLKRKNETDYAKHIAASNLIYPTGKLQERSIAISYWLSIMNGDSLINALNSTVELPANAHLFVPLFR